MVGNEVKEGRRSQMVRAMKHGENSGKPWEGFDQRPDSLWPYTLVVTWRGLRAEVRSYIGRFPYSNETCQQGGEE
jgi:hypothetical protein